MKHFRLRFLLLLTAVAASAAATALLLYNGRTAHGIAAALLMTVSACALISLVRKLICVTGTFLDALEAEDSTMKFDFGRNDPELRRMADSMNRITDIHRSNALRLETGKLYYDRVLRVMTHEMRNAITPVIAIAADMRKHPAKYKDAAFDEAAAVIDRQSDNIKRFLDAYYSLTHIPEPETTAVDAISFFTDIKAIADIETAARGLPADTCSFTVARGMSLEIDPALFTAVMTNLIRNALDAVAQRPAPAVKVTVSAADGRPYISVEDNGSGLAPEVEADIFQPFLTTKPGGSGVGLCISRQIVRRHAGDLRIASLPHGVHATITL